MSKRTIRSMRVLLSRQRRSRKRTLLRRDGAVCAQCGKAWLAKDLILKRIIHRNAGGSSRLDNLHLICHPCNRDGTHATGETA
jgi:5-methylcytosine-specific restriction endonuclease McrA